jgi:hypothetical protein
VREREREREIEEAMKMKVRGNRILEENCSKDTNKV